MIGTATAKAFSLIWSLDQTLVEIVLLSLMVSGTAILAAAIIGLVVAALLESGRFPGRGFAITLLNTMTGLPPVVLGLCLYLLLSRNGPLGFLALLYSPAAMITAQTILAMPIVAAISHGAIRSAGSTVKRTAFCLGATEGQAILAVFLEARYGIMAGIATAFGRIIGEVGAVLVVGGNIAHHTRVMTTAIALEADKGDFELAIALGIILLGISFVVNLLFRVFQSQGRQS